MWRRGVAAAAVVAGGFVLASEAGAVDLYNCSDFQYQEDAQAIYNADTSDPHGLDGPVGQGFSGLQGVACEDLPHRPSGGGGTTGGTAGGTTGATVSTTAGGSTAATTSVRPTVPTVPATQAAVPAPGRTSSGPIESARYNMVAQFDAPTPVYPQRTVAPADVRFEAPTPAYPQRVIPPATVQYGSG